MCAFVPVLLTILMMTRYDIMIAAAIFTHFCSCFPDLYVPADGLWPPPHARIIRGRHPGCDRWVSHGSGIIVISSGRRITGGQQ